MATDANNSVNNKIDISIFLELAHQASSCILDVRSPDEYAQGHVPGAINLPLLNNEERHHIGLTYKVQGQDAAIKKGFDLVGNQFASKLTEAQRIANGRPVVVYCWRGGMRSQIMQWILSLGGLDTKFVDGGYKGFRRFLLEQFSQRTKYMVLDGPTGTGKTDLLFFLKKNGEYTLDLEGAANHKGSAFGGINRGPQPTQEHFENLLGFELSKIPNERSVWIENESRLIGNCRVPDLIFNRIQNAPIVEVTRPIEQRVSRILEEYGKFPKEILIEKTKSVSRRMGPEVNKVAVELLEQNNMSAWVEMLLAYYDKSYHHSLQKHADTRKLSVEYAEITDENKLLQQLLTFADYE